MSREKITKLHNLKILEIGKRLREFAEEFGGLKKLADDIGMALPNLSQYVNGKSAPGAGLLLQLVERGCDIHYILTGKKIEYTEAGFNDYVNITRAFIRLKELEEEYPKALEEIEKLKKEREQILKLLQQK